MMLPRFSTSPASVTLNRMYRRMLKAYGPQGWWPARSTFEVMVGAILTQRTSWHNVERALRRLRAAGCLAAHTLAHCQRRRLEALVRSTGFFRQKAQRLRTFSRWYVERFGANIRRMRAAGPTEALRAELLRLNGIGPETVDAMLLYAAKRPVAMVDAYTRRIFQRHGVIRGRESYDEIQRVMMRQLPQTAPVLNEFHALLVETGKRYCHRRFADCAHCPLGIFPRER